MARPGGGEVAPPKDKHVNCSAPLCLRTGSNKMDCVSGMPADLEARIGSRSPIFWWLCAQPSERAPSD
eukprot:5347213-Alexandrium_andersonii.AAC.1